MNVSSCVLIKYGEIALRGGNRRIHENILIQSIKKRLSVLGDIPVRKDQGRLYAETGGICDADEAAELVAGVFGVTGAAACVKSDCDDFGHVSELALNHMQGLYKSPATFKVEASRTDKCYALTSHEIAANLGAHILENMPWLTVSMKNPDILLRAELRSHTYIYSLMRAGVGGLPSGSGGKAVLLLSGGFDSPVAGFLTARRGAELVCAYFHSPPYTSERAKDKAFDLARKLSEYTGGVRLYIANFTEVQLYLNDRSPDVKLTVFLKRAMLKAANLIAVRENAQALVTGDSVGQVASQTMHALAAIDPAADFPVLRPLCAMDKLDIIDIAKRIGTHDISARPYDDCCTLFLAKHPETKPKRGIIENMEKRYAELDGLIAFMVERAEIVDL